MDRFACPTTSSNSLADLCKWLEMGDVVVLVVGKRGVPYCMPETALKSAEELRVCFMDISAYPDLGHEGEWPWYFADHCGAVPHTKGDLVESIRTRSCPHMFYFRLGI